MCPRTQEDVIKELERTARKRVQLEAELKKAAPRKKKLSQYSSPPRCTTPSSFELEDTAKDSKELSITNLQSEGEDDIQPKRVRKPSKKLRDNEDDRTAIANDRAVKKIKL